MPPSIVRAVSMLQSSPTPEGRRCYVMGHVTGCHMELPKAATPTRDLPADRAPWHRVQSAAGLSSLEGRASVVVAELLAAPAGAVGPRLGTVVRVRAAGLRGRLLQPALTS